MLQKIFLALFFALMSMLASAQELHLDSKTGNDANPGTQAQPLKTLLEASKRANADTKTAPTTIILAEGIYPLTETVLFNNNKYSAGNRLLIRAAIMPDDTAWNPQRMPIVVTVVPTMPSNDGELAKGVDIESSHVTMEGIHFSGGPNYYYIDGKHNRRSYPIWRDGKTLDDLLITQCLFTGDADLLPVRVAAIANGNGFVLDHCVFYHCQNPVVFWNADSTGSHRDAMRYCIVIGSYFSGVWTTKGTAEDFEFHHNIITACGTGWIREGDHHYSIHDCIFAGNTYAAGSGADPTGGNKPNPFDFLQMQNVQTTGTIEIEKDQSKRNYLQLKEGSFGSELKAGLFKN